GNRVKDTHQHINNDIFSSISDGNHRNHRIFKKCDVFALLICWL
ncbi:MAG: hypothetical protein ACI90V_012439, partial [Bacillariaceae sp.]